MGCCGGNGGSAEEQARNRDIEKQLKADQERQAAEVKLLLLGAGDSGKSTILKQMKLIHDSGFTTEEREAFREIIVSNTVQSMRAILEAMPTLGLELEPANQEHATRVNDFPNLFEVARFPADLAESLMTLWKDPGVKAAFARSNEFQLNDSAQYYFDSLPRTSAPEYVPDDQDLLRSRVRTTGITETRFRVDELVYRMFDVGGQRSERKKWIHCFENVTAVIFVVALSAYDQVLFEDETVNRLHEALTLFDSICNSKWFVKTSMILFLNKIDLFREKLSRSPLNKHFEDFNGGADYDQAIAYFTRKFESLNQSADVKTIYVHQTCATDTSQITFVMKAVNNIIIQNNLRDAGLI